jgi:Flp pilus assembly protein TadD
VLLHGRLEEAEARLRRALTLKPNFSEAFNNLDAVNFLRGNFDAGLD